MKTLKSLLITGALFVLPVAPALALDFTQPVKTITGADFLDATGKSTELTLGNVVESSLFGAPADNADTKGKNYHLAVEIHEHTKDFNPTPDQIILIRTALAATQNTAVYGQVMSLVDPTFNKK